LASSPHGYAGTKLDLLTARFTTPIRGCRWREAWIDYLRNNRTNTSIAAFSMRAKPQAPVSMPLAWSGLHARIRPEAFTVETVPARLSRMRRDPWAGYWTCRQRLTRAMTRAFKIAG
jgi:bifunctional non-homologous end joining protein LigD